MTRLGVRRKPRQIEHREQSALIHWRDSRASNHLPGIHLLHAIPNGGARHPAVAGKMKAEGVLAGIPDLFLPVPRGRHHGLYIEMKAGSNRPRGQQISVIDQLRNLGYRVEVCYSWPSAVDVIEDYYGMARDKSKPEIRRGKYKKKKCSLCGKPFQPRGPNSKRCEACMRRPWGDKG